MSFKRVKALAAAVAVGLTAVAGTFAASASQMKIKELDNMIIDLPAGYECATRSSQSDDKYFSSYGLDYNSVMDSFKANDVYLQGMDASKLCTITVTMTKTPESEGIGNYKLLEVAGLAEVEQNFLDQPEYTACTPDESGSVTWLNFSTIINSGGTVTKIFQSNTIYDGMSINVSVKRNTGNVIPADYQTLMQVVKSVRFDTAESFGSGFTTVLKICATVAGIIVLVILILLIAGKKRKKGKEKRNDSILDELAKEHISGNSTEKKAKSDDDEVSYLIDMSDEAQPESDDDSEAFDAEEVGDYGVFFGDDDELLESVKEYRIKAQPIEEHTEPEQEADTDDDGVRIYEKSKEEKSGETASTRKFAVIMPEEEPSQQEEQSEPEPEAEEEAEEEQSEEKIFDTDEFETVTVAIGDGEDISEGIDADAEEAYDNGYEEFMNDEELVREAAKKQKFDDSYDFFDEAPSKTMGVISRNEVENAEDFDVIDELEEKVMRVEKPEEPEEEAPSQNRGKDVLEGVKTGLVKAGKGTKSFFVHCGYFCTNVYRMIKHKKAVKKRKKQEAERLARRQARLERERQSRGADGNGLVQVRSRGQSRPSSQRPSSKVRSSQGRPKSRPASANGKKRRPSNSRPPQKRR